MSPHLMVCLSVTHLLGTEFDRLKVYFSIIYKKNAFKTLDQLLFPKLRKFESKLFQFLLGVE